MDLCIVYGIESKETKQTCKTNIFLSLPIVMCQARLAHRVWFKRRCRILLNVRRPTECREQMCQVGLSAHWAGPCTLSAIRLLSELRIKGAGPWSAATTTLYQPPSSGASEMLPFAIIGVYALACLEQLVKLSTASVAHLEVIGASFAMHVRAGIAGLTRPQLPSHPGLYMGLRRGLSSSPTLQRAFLSPVSTINRFKLAHFYLAQGPSLR
ncbi:hypothetical protein JB92DRAFT_1305583 [Gautieria morchelliformis]|nr:hypothetical protein JB92DRAFT_1305583 [Gautieria morchelliformis]